MTAQSNSLARDQEGRTPPSATELTAYRGVARYDFQPRVSRLGELQHMERKQQNRSNITPAPGGHRPQRPYALESRQCISSTKHAHEKQITCRFCGPPCIAGQVNQHTKSYKELTLLQTFCRTVRPSCQEAAKNRHTFLLPAGEKRANLLLFRKRIFTVRVPPSGTTPKCSLNGSRCDRTSRRSMPWLRS